MNKGNQSETMLSGINVDFWYREKRDKVREAKIALWVARSKIAAEALKSSIVAVLDPKPCQPTQMDENAVMGK